MLKLSTLFCALTLSLTACAPQFAHLDSQWNESSHQLPTPPTHSQVPQVTLQMQTMPADTQSHLILAEAYAKALPLAPESNPYTVHIDLKPQWSDTLLSPWYLGCLVLGPLWPAMPRIMELQIEMNATIIDQRGTTHRVQIVEQERIDKELFWFGLYRQEPIDRGVQMLHRKLMARLHEQIQQFSMPVDQGIASDVY